MNGRLGTLPASQDGLLLLAVLGAVAVAGKFVLGQVYRVNSLAGLGELGVTAENNRRLYELVSQFYDETPDGTPLLVAGFDATKTFAGLCDKDTGALKALIQSENGEIRGVVMAGIGKGTAETGLNKDVFAAIPKAQALAEYAAMQMYAPLFIALEGAGYTDAASLKDLSKEKGNRVCVVLGDVTASSVGAAMGTFAGRVAASPVQRNIGRVADGALAPTKMYLGAKTIDESHDEIATIYEKGYICPRTYVGRTGYFFTDDRMTCADTDDYAHLTALRTVDKAARIAYRTLLDSMLTEIECNEDGTMESAVVKAWQAGVESAIDAEMTARGELSQSGGRGCRCHIDPSQNVVATSEIVISLGVRPYGYARTITVNIGFLIEAA